MGGDTGFTHFHCSLLVLYASANMVFLKHGLDFSIRLLKILLDFSFTVNYLNT